MYRFPRTAFQGAGWALAALCLAAAAIPSAPLAAQQPLDLDLKLETLADGIVLIRAPSDLDRWTSSNVVVIVNDEDVVVFDSNTRPSTARRVIAEIRRLTDKPVRTLINSHWHMDHWSGNGEYVKAYPGVRIVATAESRDYMKRMGASFFSQSLVTGLERRRAELEVAQRTGKNAEGKALSIEEVSILARDVEESAKFLAEVQATPRVLPNLVFDDRLTFWSGAREFRLTSETGDATGSAVLYLPAEKILVTGDVLVRPEKGDGPPPWTTNSYAITPWLESLRRLAALDVEVIAPGQGAALRGKQYLQLTADLFAAILEQVHAALERGLVKLEDVQAAVHVESFAPLYSPGTTTPSADFQRLVTTLVRKSSQEALDGVVR